MRNVEQFIEMQDVIREYLQLDMWINGSTSMGVKAVNVATCNGGEFITLSGVNRLNNFTLSIVPLDFFENPHRLLDAKREEWRVYSEKTRAKDAKEMEDTERATYLRLKEKYSE